MSTTVEEIKQTETNENKKDGLLLDSLEIKGYRCFEHLTIEKLGRVNLIVGKNNVGKTAFLEALWIYSRRGTFRTLFDLLFSRDELPVYIEKTSPLQISDVRFQKEDLISEAGNLFYGRPKLNLSSNEHISIGSNNSSISVITSRLMDQDENKTPDYSAFMEIWGQTPIGLLIISTLKEREKETRTEFYSFERLRSFLLEPPLETLSSIFIKSRILENEVLTRLWDDALKRSLEEKAKDFLKIIEPKIEYINFVGTSEGSGMRYPITNNGNSSKRVTLKSYGEGMTRLLGISLAFVQCENGMLLFDEIESGLHYSVLLDVWRLIFKTARDLNVQVFATTHSSDCLKAFQRAAEEDKKDEGMLIRLVRKGDKIKAVLFDEEELETVVENDIEVR